MANIDKHLHDIFFKEYSIKKNDIVFSLGAGIGEEIEYLSESVGKNGKVFAIEADPEIFKILKNKVLKYKYKNVVLLNLAVKDFIGKLYIVDDGGLSNYTSLTKKENSTLIRSTTMDKIVKDFNLKKIDYIKVNIEGDEVSFLNGFKKYYNIVKNWCISCHDFTGIDNQKTLKFVTNFFKENNLEYRQYDSEYIYAKYYVYVKNNNFNGLDNE